MATPKTQNRRPRRQQGAPSRGDLTGRTKAKDLKDAQDADQERSLTTLRESQEQAEEIREGVFDAQSGERIDTPKPSRTVRVVAEEDEDEDFEDDEENEDDGPAFPQFPGSQTEQEPVFSGQEDPSVVAPVIEARKLRRPRQPLVAHSPMAVIRLDVDIEDMTFGMRNGLPNNFTFFEGVAYKVPWALYEHLENLGVVRQFVSG
jgi:hypothetical protein